LNIFEKCLLIYAIRKENKLLASSLSRGIRAECPKIDEIKYKYLFDIALNKIELQKDEEDEENEDEEDEDDEDDDYNEDEDDDDEDEDDDEHKSPKKSKDRDKKKKNIKARFEEGLSDSDNSEYG
jgi:ABC-type Zn2+ transport system substrate-binding protein/surface adhesin